jgi:hypothetical protein
VQAVINYQADTIVSTQRDADLGSVEGLRAWRNMVIAAVKSTKAKGGCPDLVARGEIRIPIHSAQPNPPFAAPVICHAAT